MSRDQEDNVHDITDELCEGWANRETFAAHLHLTADSGLVRTGSRMIQLEDIVGGDMDAGRAGRVLARLLERHLDQLDDARLEDEYRLIVEDVGSMWRVDWTKVGAAFLREHYAF